MTDGFTDEQVQDIIKRCYEAKKRNDEARVDFGCGVTVEYDGTIENGSDWPFEVEDLELARDYIKSLQAAIDYVESKKNEF